MRVIHKNVLVDDNNQPIAVQIPYGDWLLIERQLEQTSLTDKGLLDLYGTIAVREDPLAYQRRIRGEWD